MFIMYFVVVKMFIMYYFVTILLFIIVFLYCLHLLKFKCLYCYFFYVYYAKRKLSSTNSAHEPGIKYLNQPMLKSKYRESKASTNGDGIFYFLDLHRIHLELIQLLTVGSPSLISLL